MSSTSLIDLLHVFPAFGSGGAEVRTVELIGHTASSLRHEVLSIDGDLSGSERLPPGRGIACEAAAGRSIAALRREVLRRRPRAVMTYGWGGVDALLAARLAGVRRVMHHEDGFLPDERAGEKPLRRWARRLAFRWASEVVVPSQTLWRIAREAWRVPEKRLRWLPNGVDSERFFPADAATRAAARRELGIPEHAVVVGTVGGLRPEKNQGRLVDAFARVAAGVPDAWLLIVGDGPLADELHSQAAAAGIAARTQFAGARLDPASSYQAMDAFALSSDTEQAPLVALEAMATGLPVVSTDVGDVATMVDPSSRSLVTPSGDETAYAATLERVLRDEGERRELGGANRRRCVEHFSRDAMLRAYEALYQRALAP